MADRDLVDDIVSDWAKQMPEIDGPAKGVVYRIGYLNERFTAGMNSRLRKQRLTVGTYGVLAVLRRSGDPDGLPAAELYKRLSLTGGGVSALIEKMEQDRLVKRTPDPNDRRGVLVKLTNTGKIAADEAVGKEAEAEAAFIADLSDAEIGILNKLMRRLLMRADGETPES